MVLAVVGSRRRPDINPDALRERVLATMRRFGALAPSPEAGAAATKDAPYLFACAAPIVRSRRHWN